MTDFLNMAFDSAPGLHCFTKPQRGIINTTCLNQKHPQFTTASQPTGTNILTAQVISHIGCGPLYMVGLRILSCFNNSLEVDVGIARIDCLSYGVSTLTCWHDVSSTQPRGVSAGQRLTARGFIGIANPGNQPPPPYGATPQTHLRCSCRLSIPKALMHGRQGALDLFSVVYTLCSLLLFSRICFGQAATARKDLSWTCHCLLKYLTPHTHTPHDGVAEGLSFRPPDRWKWFAFVSDLHGLTFCLLLMHKQPRPPDPFLSFTLIDTEIGP